MPLRAKRGSDPAEPATKNGEVGRMLSFKFLEGSPSYDTAGVFYVRVDPNIATSDELLRALYYLLWFPGYFGFNWNALSDCLRDLSWIPQCRVVLVHESLPRLPSEELRTYLGVLHDSVIDWNNDHEHDLEVVFRASDRFVVDRLMAD
jgi:hypothetical protein